MDVSWTESALADLRAVEADIARHSPQYARSMLGRILASSERLEAQPRLGAVVPRLR